MAGKKQNMAPVWKKLLKNVDLDDPTSFLDHVYLGCTQHECTTNESTIEYRVMLESRISAGANEKLTRWEKPPAKTVAWSYDMERYAQKMRWKILRTAEQKYRALKQKYRVLVWMITISRKMKGNELEN